MRVRTCLGLLGVAVAMVLGGGVGSAAAQEPIGPNQHFLGLVNGSNDDPAVYVVCPGPVYSGRTGPVAGGQTMSVARVKHGGGYTGPFTVVYSWFVPATPTPAAAPPQLKFTGRAVHDPSSQVSISSSKVIGSPQHGDIPPVPTRVMKLWQSEQYCSPS